MVGFKNEKDLVLAYYSQLDSDPIKASKYCAPDALWRGYHPFNEIDDPVEVAEKFWLPLKHSLTRMQRRMDEATAQAEQARRAEAEGREKFAQLLGVRRAVDQKGIPVNASAGGLKDATRETREQKKRITSFAKQLCHSNSLEPNSNDRKKEACYSLRQLYTTGNRLTCQLFYLMRNDTPPSWLR